MRTLNFLPFAFCFLFFTNSCTPKNSGFLTLVNSDIEITKISVDGRAFTIRPSNHITKEIAPGVHKIAVNGGLTLTATVVPNKTTVFDSMGLSCFTVIDFTERYSGGPLKVVQKFMHQQIFTTEDKMFVSLGSYLPKKNSGDHRVLRIQQVDCEIIDDDNSIAREFINIP